MANRNNSVVQSVKTDSAKKAAMKTGYFKPAQQEAPKPLVEDGKPVRLHYTAVDALMNMIEMFSGRSDTSLLRSKIEQWWLATHTNKTTNELYLVDAKTALELFEKNRRLLDLGPDSL